MDPNEFFFLILPLAALVFTLVFLVFYLARKEVILYAREVDMFREFLLSGIFDRVNFASILHRLLYDKKINQDTYERLGKLLEVTFKEQVQT